MNYGGASDRGGTLTDLIGGLLKRGKLFKIFSLYFRSDAHFFF